MIRRNVPVIKTLGFYQLKWLTSTTLSFTVLLLTARVAIAQSPSQSTAPPPQPTSAGAPTSRPLLRIGSEGADVADIQAMLTLLGFYRGPIDGRYGESTAVAVGNFQRAAGLNVDGIVGQSTWNSLLPAVGRISASPIQETAPSTPTEIPANSENISSPPPSEVGSQSNPAVSSTTPPNPTTSRPATSSQTVIPYVEYPILRRGMQGAAVIGLQERLRILGIYDGPIDGVFGPQTETAVKAAQRQLNLTPDGVVGSATWTAILP